MVSRIAYPTKAWETLALRMETDADFGVESIRIIKYHDVGGRCADEFLSAQEALREGQGDELSTWYQENVPACHQPKCFTKPAAALSSAEAGEKAAAFCRSGAGETQRGGPCETRCLGRAGARGWR